MPTQEVKCKLVAILSADVKGYNSLVGEDEVQTLKTLSTYFQIMTTLIQKHQGRVLNIAGDNLVADFESVVDAVQCGVEIQKELRTKNAELPEGQRVEFGIGIDLDDVVDIATLLGSLSEAGGICISGTAYDQVENKLSLGYEYLGEQTVKTIAKSVRVYRVLIEPETVSKAFIENNLDPRHWSGNGHKEAWVYNKESSCSKEKSDPEELIIYNSTERLKSAPCSPRSPAFERSFRTKEGLDAIIVRRKGRIEYFDPMELHTEYPFKIALLREMKEKSTNFKGVTIKWQDIGFKAEEENPEVEIVPKSTFFLFSPPKRIVVIKADKDVFIDFKMRPLLLTQSTRVEIEFLYKREPIGLIGIDVRIQDKLKIVGSIRLSHDKWRKVISIGTVLASIGVFLDVARNLFQSWRHIWLGSFGYVLIAASIPPFLLGTLLGAKGSRRRSKIF